MARNNGFTFIDVDSKGNRYYIGKRSNSDYYYLFSKLKNSKGKWTTSKQSLKISNHDEAFKRAKELLGGVEGKRLKAKANAKRKKLQEWKDMFLREFKNIHTKSGYEKDLDRFIYFVNTNYSEVMFIDELEYTHVKTFQDNEKHRKSEKNNSLNITENTIKGEMKTLGSWLGEARRHGFIQSNPMDLIRVGSIRAREEVFYPDEIKKIKKEAQKDKSIYAVIILLLQRGLRIEEIIEAKREYFKEESRILEIPKPKEKYPKKIGLPRSSNSAIKKLSKKSVYLFPNPHNSNSDKWVKLDRDISNFCRDLGIKGNPHKFRHTFCSYSVAVRGDKLMEISRLMGHRSLTTTQKYIHYIKWEIPDAIKRVFDTWKK